MLGHTEIEQKYMANAAVLKDVFEIREHAKVYLAWGRYIAAHQEREDLECDQDRPPRSGTSYRCG